MQISHLSTEPADARSDNPAYTYRPSLLGAPRDFRLDSDGIDWVAGRRSGHIPFRDIRRVRVSFRPASMQSHRFMTELWAVNAPKLTIMSSSWRSMVEQVRQDKPYSAFIAELHRRIALAAPPARYEQGSLPLLYWPGLIVFAGVAIGFAVLMVRALQNGTGGAAVVVGAFLVLFLWQGGNFFRRNRPGLYRPEAPPARLMPNP
jgi:hypothetical protein